VGRAGSCAEAAGEIADCNAGIESEAAGDSGAAGERESEGKMAGAPLTEIAERATAPEGARTSRT
jgi:hypothetical protein